jgi:hypothetical protein
MSNHKLILKRVQTLISAGLKELWDREVDAFAIGLGEDDGILDIDRDIVISRIMTRLETAITNSVEFSFQMYVDYSMININFMEDKKDYTLSELHEILKSNWEDMDTDERRTSIKCLIAENSH